MAVFRDRDKQHFPLKSSKDVLNLFKDQLDNDNEPNLALLSITLGYIENTLTVNRSLSNIDKQHEQKCDLASTTTFPVVDLKTVEALYQKFVSLVKGGVDLTKYEKGHATRDFVKCVSDVIWRSLTRTYYKDRAHLQSLYSYLTGDKLDCFGVAFAVIAACQILGYNDVHLALSEDHAWVVFGENGKETAEVTWHGKGNEDKRGLPIDEGIEDKRWLYLKGHAVICTRQMELAAIVSGINVSLNATTDSVELGGLQKDLLWLLYDKNHIHKYPMAIGNLGDLEEISRSVGRPEPLALFQEAISSAQIYYDNHHVYPYTYLGGFLKRKGQYKEAFRCWAEAASVIKKYNYNRNCEEIYKEFLEIATDSLPHLVKAESSKSENNFLSDPECYISLLRFYDGICMWEEGSSTPVLHVGWAQQFVYCLSKFDPEVREQITIVLDGEINESEKDNYSDDEPVEEKKTWRLRASSSEKSNPEVKPESKEPEPEQEKPKTNGNSEEERIKSTIQELETKVAAASDTDSPNPNIAALAQACSESILNPEYLLASTGDPFASTTQQTSNPLEDLSDLLNTKPNGSPFPGFSVEQLLNRESPIDNILKDWSGTQTPSSFGEPTSSMYRDVNPEKPVIVLESQKMKTLKKLLSSKDKFNANAIKLQLTAQSQVFVKCAKRGGTEKIDYSLATRKRSRRESH